MPRLQTSLSGSKLPPLNSILTDPFDCQTLATPGTVNVTRKTPGSSSSLLNMVYYLLLTGVLLQHKKFRGLILTRSMARFYMSHDICQDECINRQSMYTYM